VKFVRILYKAERRKLTLKLVFMLVIFIVTFFSFTYFIESYNQEWTQVTDNSVTPDFEIYINMNSSHFLEEYNAINMQFNNLDHKLISSLPIDLVELEINNITQNSVSLFIVNQNINSDKFFKISDQSSILVVKNETSPIFENTHVKWNLNTSIEFFNISQIIGESYFREILGDIHNLEFLRETSYCNIIISDRDFFNFVDNFGLNLLQNFIITKRINLFSSFNMNKTEFLNKLPQKLRKGYDNWVSNIQLEFFNFYDAFSSQNEYFIDFQFNNIYSEKLTKSLQSIRLVLLNSLIFSIPFSLFFLYFLYYLIKQEREENAKIVQVFSSRGMKLKAINLNILLFQILIAGFSLIISLLTCSIFLAYKQYSTNTVNLLIFFLSHSFILVILNLFVLPNARINDSIPSFKNNSKFLIVSLLVSCF